MTAHDTGQDAPKLAIRELTKTFPGRRGSDDVVALGGHDARGVALDVAEGQITALVGTSGCGKSTLLRIVAGLDMPTGGEVLVDGEPVVGPGPDRGMVFQGYSLFPWLTVAGNITFGLELAGLPRRQRAERLHELLGIMGLSDHAQQLSRNLSGGMRQRVAIARALAPEPDVLLLDEPFGALDAQTRLSMHEFLLTVWQRTGATILFVTHDVDEAVYLAQQVHVMHAEPGRIVDTIAIPFEGQRGPAIKRERRFLDLRDEVHDLLLAQG
jgi:ABC-type nitrate/sulfonate/bicarbonate transport system ATPase subunit